LDTFYEVKSGLLKKASLALGFFDGVHPGHQVVIQNAVAEAKKLGLTPGVVTFKEHPRSLTLGKSPPLLTLIDQRLELFGQLGIEAALVLSFTEELCRLAPEDYVHSVLVEAMGARALSVGFNHRFGRNRVGDAELLRKLGVQFGYTVHVACEVIIDGSPVSSSRIRDAITNGGVEQARHLLGRPFAISGTVDHGEGRGHALGFPTANITISEEQVEPAIGVYVAVVRLPNAKRDRLPAVVNIGRRPTFGTSDAITTEVHLLDYDANLYGQKLQLEFLRHLRSERKFASVDELKLQIGKDVQETRQYFADHDEKLTVKIKSGLAAESH
jgi:riboflavin kinase/FMN adenylyltransferase